MLSPRTRPALAGHRRPGLILILLAVLFVAAAMGGEVASADARLRVRISATPNGVVARTTLPVAKVRWWVNGRPAARLATAASARRSSRLRLGRGRHVVRVRATRADGRRAAARRLVYIRSGRAQSRPARPGQRTRSKTRTPSRAATPSQPRTRPSMPERPSDPMPDPEAPRDPQRPVEPMPQPETPGAPQQPSEPMPEPEMPGAPQQPSEPMPEPETPGAPQQPSEPMPEPETPGVPQQPGEPNPEPEPPVAPQPRWISTFADGSFREWSNFRRDDGGTFYVARATDEGVPAPPSGNRNVAHFELTADQVRAGRIHSKLYKGWDTNNARRTDDAGRRFARVEDRGSGAYSAWYFIPTDYRMAVRGPVNIFQFKEDYSADAGATFNGFGSDMQTSLALWSAAGVERRAGVLDRSAYRFGLRADHPILSVDLWHRPAVTPRPGHQPGAVPAPLGRWFNVTAKVMAGDRVEYWVDGRHLDTWHHDEYPVGVRYANAMGWTFGVGHYGPNVGTLWVADVAYAPLR